MHPILFTIGPITLYSYGVMLVAGFLATIWLAVREARRWPPEQLAIRPEQIADFASIALLAGILGGRLVYAGLNWRYFARAPHELIAIWHGGLVWYGGFAGGLLGAWLYVRAKRLSFVRVMDQFLPFVAVGHALGRIGCFLNGCCYGKPTTSWCGVVFPGHPGRVIPTQLIEAAGLLALFLVLRRLQRPDVLRGPGAIFGAYLIGYGLLRFGVEFLRGDQAVLAFGLTLQQVVSAGLLAAGLVLIRRARAHGAHV